MEDTRAIDLRLRLPSRLAEEVERVKVEEPEVLSRIVEYGLTRRAIYDHLVSRGARAAASP